MTLLNEIEEFFGTRNLYQVLNIDEKATPEEVKKGYRKTSLKIHPDRVEESEKDRATKRFQVLAQVHYILNDEEKRKLYDEHGIVTDGDDLEGQADWDQYWRLIFPKITEKDIQQFLDDYIGSENEESDLIDIYNRYKGDLDKISETLIGFDEERITSLLNDLIEAGKIPKYKSFTAESAKKKNKRKSRAVREAKQADEFKEELRKNTGKSLENIDDLTALIRSRQQGSFNSMIASLESKYGGKSSKKRRKNA